ncbi:MAG: hypothetical protein CM15mP130_2790 [Verrucomicrobiota bacterium]|nr:MAG: hypothetical protein CM15mP130_2790 [Verrucomicrobiota bacterium]
MWPKYDLSFPFLSKKTRGAFLFHLGWGPFRVSSHHIKKMAKLLVFLLCIIKRVLPNRPHFNLLPGFLSSLLRGTKKISTHIIQVPMHHKHAHHWVGITLSSNAKGLGTHAPGFPGLRYQLRQARNHQAFVLVQNPRRQRLHCING